MQSQHRRRDRRALAAAGLAIAVLCSSALLSGHAGAANGLSADQVADQILEVQEDADDAAGRLAELDDEANDLADQVAATQQDVDATSARYAEMEDDLATIALNKYTGALEHSNLPFAGGPIMDEVQTGQLAQFALGAGEVDLGELGAVRRDLDRQRTKLAGLQERNDTAREQLAATQDALDSKITRLTELEAELRDAEVRAAYEAKLAAKRQREAEAAEAAERRAAAATTVPPRQRWPAASPAPPPPPRRRRRPRRPPPGNGRRR